jgi:hypothetical protein
MEVGILALFVVEVEEFLGPGCGVCVEMRSVVFLEPFDVNFLLAILNFILRCLSVVYITKTNEDIHLKDWSRTTTSQSPFAWVV